METFDPPATKSDKPQTNLPSALLKRLAKRGLIEKNKAKKLIETAEKREKIDKEEIIAEDYDEIDDNCDQPNPYDYEYIRKPEENLWLEKMKTRMSEGGNTGYKCCPNKYNIFHKCTLFCVNKWGDGILEQAEVYIKRKKRLLKRYPLPHGWTEVYDVGCGAHYYWNHADDTVSWLPPSHPKAHISKSAGCLRRELEESVPIDMDFDAQVTDEDVLKIPTALNFNSISEPVIEKSQSIPPPRKPKTRDLDKALRTKKERRQRREEADKLDPMDPAAYSDIPRGTWASGLNNEERQTGADITASGSLYQMRPYPNPGAVLKANKKGVKGSNSDDDEDVDDIED